MSMKNSVLAIFLIYAAISSATHAQSPDAILGYWHSPHGRMDIQILKNGDTYSGITTSRVPHPGQHHIPPEGTAILRDFKYRANGVYNRGKVIDTRSGKTYNGQIRLLNNDKIEVRIFFGIIQFGRTETWSRIH